jgi:hypothetical protein
VLKKQIFFKVILTTCNNDQYQQITTGIVSDFRQPENKVENLSRGTIYTTYFDNLSQTCKFIGDLLEHVRQDEQMKLDGFI